MNTNGLARHYQSLTPWERLPLMVGASARADEVERDRLARSAPTHDFRVPDYWGLCEGLKDLATLYLLRQLDLATLYRRIAGHLDQRPPFSAQKRDRRRRRRLGNELRMLAYRCVTQADGWTLLCAGLHVDPEALLRDLPGHETVWRIVEEARLVAFGAVEAAAYLRVNEEAAYAEGGDAFQERRDCRIDTAEDAARAMREHLEARLDLWR